MKIFCRGGVTPPPRVDFHGKTENSPFMLTLRQAIRELLREEPHSALELSQRLSLPEKEVYGHLQHVARNPGAGWRFHLIPAVCRICGFTFSKRQRLTIPSRCPVCRRQSIQRPRYVLKAV